MIGSGKVNSCVVVEVCATRVKFSFCDADCIFSFVHARTFTKCEENLITFKKYR